MPSGRIPQFSTAHNIKGQIEVRQPRIHGWDVSYNPDDGMFHVANLAGRSVSIQYHWRNVIEWCRTHTVEQGPAWD